MARMSIEAVESSNEAADPYNSEDGTLGTQTRGEEKTSLGSETTWWPADNRTGGTAIRINT
jgi:hypothetical protein